MYRELMTDENIRFIERAILHLGTEVGSKQDDGSFWMCYGSFVLNQQTPESDIDLLYVHRQATSVQRIQASFEGYPVTIYSLSRNDFLNDGKRRKFGGYFAGKALNPNVIFLGSVEDKRLLQKTAGEYIAPFAATIALRHNRSVSTKANLAADSVLARLHICPWYRSYFLRYYLNPDFSKLWNQLEHVVSAAFLEAGAVIPDGENFQYVNLPFPEDLHTETIKVAARFWALGCSLHGAMPDFPDFYFQKSDQAIKQHDLQSRCDEMMVFLESKASGRSS